MSFQFNFTPSVTLMLSTGSLVTIVLKWQNDLSSINSFGRNVKFSHPFLQSTFMFLGEYFCLIAFFMQRYFLRFLEYIHEVSNHIRKGKFPIYSPCYLETHFSNPFRIDNYVYINKL